METKGAKAPLGGTATPDRTPLWVEELNWLMVSVAFGLGVVGLQALVRSPANGWNWGHMVDHGELLEASVILGVIAVGQLLKTYVLEPNWSRPAFGIPAAVFTTLLALAVGGIGATHATLTGNWVDISVLTYVVFVAMGSAAVWVCR